ncbi:MAG: hypothetical protein U0168_31015 [Nannocystaceae bacterium]
MELAGCAGNSECIELAGCVGGCLDADDPMCIAGCCELHPSGLAPYDALAGCQTMACAMECDGFVLICGG